MTKIELRTKCKERRFALSKTERDTMSINIANQALKLPIWHLKTYHIFLPIEKLAEVDTSYILTILHGKEKQIAVPKTEPKTKTLRHFLLTDETLLKKNPWGVPEPVNGQEISPDAIDIVFIPLLAYDHKGNRIGYGGGFYDRFLQQCSPKTIKIGLSFFNPETETIETNPFDIALDYCITPSNIFKFSK